ncbi:chaperone protein dnaJ 11, chloroplastic-like [Eucalyptus grandis]|uniref:chaperone protein dnaJ 11, chloroplastic-like n=1 Tax=Eucalyptus grandis TaxID=71139 RepID=UPI00192EC0AA|nr:chaperone protein dnaJ 11, chloroplastic-like [Eucalyptus grandis]
MSKLGSLQLPHLPSGSCPPANFGKSRPRKSNVVSAAATATVEPVLTVKDSSATLYQVLRVKASASQAEIKAAYRSLAKLYHPDSASANGDEGDFVKSIMPTPYCLIQQPELATICLYVHIVVLDTQAWRRSQPEDGKQINAGSYDRTDFESMFLR